MCGELGYREWELWDTTWIGIILALQGLRDKDYAHESMVRRLAAAVVSSGNNKRLANGFATFWPDPRKNQKKRRNVDPNSPQAMQLRRFKQMEAEKKFKDAGRT